MWAIIRNTGIKIICIFSIVFVGKISAETNKSVNNLDLCVYLYENGEYANAVDSLKSLIPSLDKSDQSQAYKYLAFSYVMLDMINKAKAKFEDLLHENPQFEIDTVLIPPNITIVFKQVKQEKELQLAEEKIASGSPNGTLIWSTASATGLIITGGLLYFFLKDEDKKEEAKTNGDMVFTW